MQASINVFKHSITSNTFEPATAAVQFGKFIERVTVSAKELKLAGANDWINPLGRGVRKVWKKNRKAGLQLWDLAIMSIMGSLDPVTAMRAGGLISKRPDFFSENSSFRPVANEAAYERLNVYIRTLQSV